MLQNKKTLAKVFVLVIFAIIFQTFLQNSVELKGIITTITGYLKPFIYGIFIAVFIHPISLLFEKKIKKSRVLPIILAFLTVFLVVSLVITIILPGLINSIREIGDRSPMYLEKLSVLADSLLEKLKVSGLVKVDTGDLETFITSWIKSIDSNFYTNIAKNVSVSMLGLLTFLGQVGVGSLLAIFLVKDREYFNQLVFNVVRMYSNKKNGSFVLEFLDNVRRIFLNYMWGKTLSSFALGLIVFLILFIGKVPYSGLIAMLIGIGNMIPYVGTLIASVIAMLLVVIVDPSKIWIIVTAALLGNQIEGLLISPMLIGKTVGLSAFWVITGVLLGGAIFGVVGMVLGVPAIAVAKYIYGLKLKNLKEEN